MTRPGPGAPLPSLPISFAPSLSAFSLQSHVLVPSCQDGGLVSSRLTVPSRGFSLPNPTSGDCWVPSGPRCPFLCPFLAGPGELCVWELTALLALGFYRRFCVHKDVGWVMMEQGGDFRCRLGWVGSWDTGEKLGQNRATGIMTRSHHDAVIQKYGSLRCKGNKLEAVSNFPEAYQHILPPVREIRFQAEIILGVPPSMGSFLHFPDFPSPLGILISESLHLYFSKSVKSTPLRLREGHSRGTGGITVMVLLS